MKPASGTGVVNGAAVLAAAICLLVFIRALSCGFVELDDPDYVLNNPLIRQLNVASLADSFLKVQAGFWMPLTWVSFAVDYHFWGLNPRGYHLTNIALHALNSGLVVLIADALVKSQGGIGQKNLKYGAVLLLAGLVWSIHPLRAESVVWVTERKDVLNGLLTLGSIYAYLGYVARRETGKSARFHYMASFLLFACSLMAKSISVVLPVVLLLLDRFPLNRLRGGAFRAVLLEKLPFVAVSALVSVATVMIASQKNILIDSGQLGYGLRTIIAGNAMFEYLRLILFPFGISPLYVIPDPIPYAFAVKAALALVAACCCAYAGRKRPWLQVLWLLFVVSLLPVSGFLQNGDAAYAARFTYLASIPFSIAVAIAICNRGACQDEKAGRFFRVTAASLCLLILVYAGMTQGQIGVWKDTGTMWTRVIEQQGLGRAYQERGIFYLVSGRYVDAVNDFSIAIDVVGQSGLPPNYNLIAHRGEAFRMAGQPEDAVRDLSLAISLAPYPAFYYRRGLALAALGRQREAEDDFRQAGKETGALGWY